MAEQAYWYVVHTYSGYENAVKAAIERGELSAERWESYCRLKNEAKYSEDKTGYLREKQQWHKNVAKISRSLRKSGRTEKW